MPMRDQPEGVHRKRRGTERPPREYAIYVDGEFAGVAEVVKRQKEWRLRRDGSWPRKFTGRSAYLDGVSWLAAEHRAAKRVKELTSDPVAASEDAGVRKLTGVVADPFAGDPFSDPLA